MSILLLIALAGGCAHVDVGGEQVRRQRWERTVETLRPRAAFEMNCPIEELLFQPLVVRVGVASQVGVSGCGHRLVYVFNAWGAGWTLNSDSSLNPVGGLSK